MAAHTFNPNTQEAKQEDHEFKVSLGYKNKILVSKNYKDSSLKATERLCFKKRRNGTVHLLTEFSEAEAYRRPRKGKVERW
jgi:hypothetical protein